MTKKKAPNRSVEWFRDARFGMFIHWGIYSVLGRHEWAMFYERIPREEYRKLAQRFNPKKWNPREWVALPQEACMRYLCLTTRHHDGFSLFDSKANPFNSAQTAAGRDLVAEYVEACRAGRMGVGLYYSVADWSDAGYVAGPKADPDGWRRFVRYVKAELRQLMTDYGRIDYLFYDGCPPPKTWGCAAMNREIRRLQPHLLISSRCQLDEDVASAEQHVMADPGKLWECCMTMNQSWGYNWGDPAWKDAREIVRTLMVCCHQGGNFLLNVGPKPDGAIPAQSVKLLKQVGQWVKANGDAVYGTDPHPFDYYLQKLATGKGSIAYVPLHHYHGPKTVIAGVANRVKSVRVLATGKETDFEQQGERILLTGLPRRPPDSLLPVLALELAGRPRGVPNPLRGDKSKYD